MELSMPLSRLVTSVLVVAMVLIVPALAQVSMPCSASMIASFSPCMNFVTNSSANGTSPTSACCNALKTLTTSSRDCMCLIVTGGIPLPVPINRTLGVSLPRACNMPGVPLQCKSTGAPIPAPGPTSFGPTLPPKASPFANPSASPKASTDPKPISPTLSPKSDTPPVLAPPTTTDGSTLSPESDTPPVLTPPTTTDGSEAPTATTGSRSSLTPSTAAHSYGLSASVLLFAMGSLVMWFY